MSELLEDYAETLTRVEHLVFSDAYRRVISVLLYIAKHFGENDSKQTKLIIVYPSGYCNTCWCGP